MMILQQQSERLAANQGLITCLENVDFLLKNGDFIIKCRALLPASLALRSTRPIYWCVSYAVLCSLFLYCLRTVFALFCTAVLHCCFVKMMRLIGRRLHPHLRGGLLQGTDGCEFCS